jgi:hypothetical protein
MVGPSVATTKASMMSHKFLTPESKTSIIHESSKNYAKIK